MVLNSPKKCFENAFKIRTVKDAINLPSKTLGYFNKQYGREWTIGYVSTWLIDLNDNANVKQRMNDNQIEFTAERILDLFPLKITDITLFFRNIKEGAYGQYYESLGQEKILSWLHYYWDDRCNTAELLSQSGHDKFSMTKDPIHPEVAKELFKDVGKEKVEFNNHKRGIGYRSKEQISKTMILAIKDKTDEELKNYIVNHDYNSETYDEFIYLLVEKELDLRNTKK